MIKNLKGIKPNIHEDTFIAESALVIGAIILNKAVIGDNCIIGAGAVITEEKIIPPNSLVLGVPGKVVRQVTEEEIRSVRDNAIGYYKLYKKYKATR